MELPYVVGRFNFEFYSEPPLAAFKTAEDAEQYIGLIISNRDPVGVSEGYYYIDGPER